MKKIFLILLVFVNTNAHLAINYLSGVAQVRLGGDLSYSEKIFLKNRSEKVKVMLEQFGQVNYVPRVAICASGGGYRAMISFLGFLLGLEKTGILDCITYISALSGSSWTLASWMSQNKNLSDLKDHLSLQTQESITSLSLSGYKNIISNILAKTMKAQSVGITDIYGQAIALKLLNGFADDSKKLTSCAQKILQGDMFLPIYTAAIVDQKPYQWMEFTPFEVGSSFLNCYVPSWAFNRTFDKGVSTSFENEPKLDFLMGIFGSAFSANIKDVLNHTGNYLEKQSPKVYNLLKNYKSHWIADVRLSSTKINNFAFGVPESPLSENHFISLADAGLDFNLPLPPLLERPVDIIIVFDASFNSGDRNELINAQAYAINKNLNWPGINTDKLSQKRISIFRADNESPIIIYMPLCNEKNEYKNGYDWKQANYAQSWNFKYNQSEFEDLLGLAEFNAIKSAPEILKTILELAQ